MRTASFCFEILLLIWFWGCIVSYRFGKVYLVEGMGVKSPEFVMFAAYCVCIVLRLLIPRAGDWAALVILALWLTIQYFCHWHYTIFGATPEKIDGYNRCFAGTVCIVPRRADRLIPDLYHIVLHLLIAGNLILLLLLVCG